MLSVYTAAVWIHVRLCSVAHQPLPLLEVASTDSSLLYAAFKSKSGQHVLAVLGWAVGYLHIVNTDHANRPECLF